MPNRVCVGVVASKAAPMVTMPTQRAIGSGPSKDICSQNAGLNTGEARSPPSYLPAKMRVAVKNPLLRNSQKLDRIGMPYKRSSRRLTSVD